MQPGKPDHLWRATVERNLALTSIALHNGALHYYLVVALDEFLSRHFVGCERGTAGMLPANRARTRCTRVRLAL